MMTLAMTGQIIEVVTTRVGDSFSPTNVVERKQSLPFRLITLPFALTALAVKQTDSGATRLRRPFVERHA
jgi:hypothetical protein